MANVETERIRGAELIESAEGWTARFKYSRTDWCSCPLRSDYDVALRDIIFYTGRITCVKVPLTCKSKQMAAE